MSEDEDEWQSGPWCRHHYREPGDCDECAVLCMCGHPMSRHAEEGLWCEECGCASFKPGQEST